MSRLRLGLRQSVRDYAAVAQWRDAGPEYGKGQPTDTTPFGGNVGELMAAEMAAAGTQALVLGGQTPCETDYLAASGATFPVDVPRAEMDEFNRRTLRPEMDEADEFARYAAIAKFFGRSPHAV